MSDQWNDPTTFTAALAADPATEIGTLAAIANQRPDLHAALASNPAAPADLLAWLGSLGNPQVSAALAARAQTAAASAPTPPPAAEPGAWGTASPTPVPVAETEAASGYPSTEAPQQPDASYASGFGPGVTPGYGGVPDAVAPKRSRTGVWIGIAAAGALVLGGGAFAATKLLSTDTGGSSSPETAATNFIEGLSDGDTTKALKATSPTESGYASQLTKIVTQHLSEVDSLKAVTSDVDPSEVAGLYTLKSEGLTFSSQELADSATTRVTVEDAVITVSVDADKVVALTKKYSDSVQTLSSSLEGSVLGSTAGGGTGFDADAESELRSEIEDSFPAVITVEGGHGSVTTPSESTAQQIDVPLSAITVKEDDAWYVSPLLTVADYALTAADVSQRGSLASVGDVKGAGSAQEAGTAFFKAIEATVSSGDLSDLESALPLAERRVLAFVEPIYSSEDVKSVIKKASGLAFDGAAFKERDSQDGIARLELTGLKIGFTTQGVTVNGEWKDGCLTAEALAQVGGKTSYCLSDDEFAGLRELGIDQLSFVALKEGGGWFLSLPASTADAAGVILAKVVALVDAGKFKDQQWLEDNFGGLTSLFGGVAGATTGTDLGGLSGLSGTDDGSATDVTPSDDTPPATGTDQSGTAGASLESELTSARSALASYLKENPKAVWPDVTSLQKYGYTPADDVTVLVTNFEGAKDYCLGGYDMQTYAMASMDEKGTYFTDDTLCTSK